MARRADRFHAASMIAAVVALLMLAAPAARAQEVSEPPDIVRELSQFFETEAGQEVIAEFTVSPEQAGSVFADPAGDLVHSTGQPPGGEVADIRTFGWSSMTVNPGELADHGFALDSEDAIRVPIIYKPPARTAPFPDAPQEMVVFWFEADRPVALDTGGRCEYMLWAGFPGPTFENLDVFPFDPARGTNRAFGIGVNNDGSAGTFELEFPGTGGFLDVPETDVLGAVSGNQVAIITPLSHVAEAESVRGYFFCTEDFSFAPEVSAADETDLLAFDAGRMASLQFTVVEPAPTTTQPPSTTAAVVSPTAAEGGPGDAAEALAGEGGGFPWLWVGLPGLLLLGGGALVLRSRRRAAADGGPAVAVPPGAVDPCDRLRRVYAQARAEAEARKTEADQAEQDATEAEREAERAGKQAEDAAAEREQAEDAARDRHPGEEESWIEDETGRRITGRDVRLRREAGEEAWEDYRREPSPESAAETEQKWKDLDKPGAAEERRARDEVERERRRQEAEQAGERDREARERSQQAEQKAGEARARADEARRRADEAEARAAEARRRLEECEHLAGGGTISAPGGGTTTIGRDAEGKCYPEGNEERRVVKGPQAVMMPLSIEINRQSDAEAAAAAGFDLARDLGDIRDALGWISTAMDVKSGVKLLKTRDGWGTVGLGATTGFTKLTDIPVPTSPAQLVTEVLRGTAGLAEVIVRKFSEWTRGRTTVDLSVKQRHRRIEMVCVETWRCTNGEVVCVSRALEVTTGDVITRTRREEGWTRDTVGRRARGWESKFNRELVNAVREIEEFEEGCRAGDCD